MTSKTNLAKGLRCFHIVVEKLIESCNNDSGDVCWQVMSIRGCKHELVGESRRHELRCETLLVKSESLCINSKLYTQDNL
jgi:hypothetical protein